MDVPKDGQLISGSGTALPDPGRKNSAIYLGDSMPGLETLSLQICSLAVELTQRRLTYEYPEGLYSEAKKDEIFQEVLSHLLWACEHEYD